MTGRHTTSAEWRSHPRFGTAPALTLDNEGVRCTRLVVVAAHPDDESLGAGGLIATAADAGLDVYVVLLTAGEASRYAEPDSTRHTLATMRLAEMERALTHLAPENTLVFLGAPDGLVADSEEAVTRSLVELVGDGSHTLVAAPWRHDGHPDHEAAGRCAAAAARAGGARLVEFPLLGWGFTTPDELAWDRARRLDLDDAVAARKQAAIRAHVSQVRGTEGAVAGAPLPGRVLAHFTGPVEHYLEACLAAAPTRVLDEDAGQSGAAVTVA
ncbi:MAG: hypothetical protein CMH83_05995 [Nocardioides sp.]|nr:hypothetical protein [Nocardioides sp.]